MEMNEIARTWKEMKTMAGIERKWMEMQGNEVKWTDIERKWKEMTGNERKTQIKRKENDMKPIGINGTYIMEIKGNERTLKKHERKLQEHEKKKKESKGKRKEMKWTRKKIK